MKEANDPNYHEEYDHKRGGWDMRKFMLNVTEYDNWKRTYEPIIQSTYGINNNGCDWDDVPDMNDQNKNEMVSLLHQIAFINIKKLPGLASSWWETINDAYQKHKEIILEQIEVINPEIIIGGGTLPFLCQDLNLPADELECNGSYFTKSRVYLDVYHPNQRKITHKAYYENIIEPVKYWINNYR